MTERYEPIREPNEGELFRLLVENVRDYAIFVLDPEGHVRSWNPGAERLLGYTEAEILGRPASLFFTPEDILAGVQSQDRAKAVETGRGEDERWHVRKDGSRFWSSGAITPLWDEGRNLRGFAKIVRDRTSQKQGEDALKDALDYTHGVVDTVREPLLVLGGDLRVRTANRSFYQTFRVSPGETEGRLVYHLGDHLWDIPRLRTLLEEILPKDTSFDGFEVEHEFGAIGRKVMLLNARRFYREGNHTDSILLAIEDITERRLAEEGRHAVETRFTSLVKNISDHAIFTMDPQGRITSWNVEAERILGHSEEEIIGRRFAVIFTPEDIVGGIQDDELRKARVVGRAVDERWHVRKGGQRFWALGIVTPTHDAGGRHTGFSKILRDMTEQKLAEEQLQRAHDEAETKVRERTAELRTANDGLQKEIEDRKFAERRLNAQYATTKTLADSPDLKAAIPTILKSIGETLEWHWGAVWLMDPLADGMRMVQCWNHPSVDLDEFLTASREKTFTYGKGLPGRVWASGRAVWVTDVTQDVSLTRRGVAARCGLLSAVAFPIAREDEVLGVVEFFSRRIEQPDEKILGMMRAIGSNIGQFIERKRVEEGLRLFRALIDQTTDGIEVIDPATGRFLDVNEKACAAHGYDREEYLSLRVPDVDPAFDSVAWGQLIEERRLGGSRPFEGTHRRKDGSTFPVEINLNFVGLDRDYLVAVVRDITSRREAETALLLRDRAIQVVTQGIVITDSGRPDAPIVYASAGFLNMTGYPIEEALGRNCRFLQGDKTDPAAVSRIREAVQQGQRCTVELLNYGKDGAAFWNELSLAPVTDADGRLTHYIGVQTDVTGRHQLEDQFRQAQKMEAFGQLAGGVAHDFNNLLTIISGYSELMLASLRHDDRHRWMVEEIHKSGDRAAQLTRQLLAFSRKQVVQPQVLDLNAVVAVAEKMLGRLIGEDVTLTAVPAPGLGLVKADPGQVEQVIMNLVVNARDAMPRGGRITIETANVVLDKSYGQSPAEVAPGRYVLLAVSDTGCGMTEEVKRHLFEPFFTTKEVGKGTGLGLATVFGIVKQSGGHIGVYSEVGRGTTFEIYLPSVDEVARTKKPKEGPSATLTGTEMVLLVEDEKAVRAMTRMALQMKGYTVLEAADGSEAVRLCERHPGPIHLLVSDVVMPEMGGRELADVLTALHPEMRVLFVSGYTDDAVMRHGVLEAEVAFLQKPFTVDALHRKVRDVLDAKG